MIDKEKLKKLKECQEKQASIKGSIDTIKMNLANQLLEPMKVFKELDDEIKTLKSELTEEGLKEFEETENKTLTGGLKIRVKKSISYNENLALSFCLNNKMFLKADLKAFEKAVEGLRLVPNLNLDFVKNHTDNQVTFPEEIKLGDD